MTTKQWDEIRRRGIDLRNPEAIAAVLNEGRPAEQHVAVEILEDRIIELTGEQYRRVRKARAEGQPLCTPAQLTAFLQRTPRVIALDHPTSDHCFVKLAEVKSIEQRSDVMQCAGCKSLITMREYRDAAGACPHCGVVKLNPGGVVEVGA